MLTSWLLTQHGEVEFGATEDKIHLALIGLIVNFCQKVDRNGSFTK